MIDNLCSDKYRRQVCEMSAIPRKAFAVAGVFLAIAVAVFLYFNYRNGVMERAYAEATGYPQFYRDAEHSQAALQTLASYQGRQSTRMLLDIASRQNFLAPDVQAAAIKALVQRKDPQISMPFADLLQPHEPLGTRQAAADALARIGCTSECVRSVLHYLERVSRGDLNEEDRVVFPGDTESLKAAQKKEQDLLYATLYSILQQQKTQVLTWLIRIYGLGSEDPAPFALELVSHLQLHEACPYLLQTNQAFKSSPTGLYTNRQTELAASINALQCK
jgi:hypothetical protein